MVNTNNLNVIVTCQDTGKLSPNEARSLYQDFAMPPNVDYDKGATTNPQDSMFNELTKKMVQELGGPENAKKVLRGDSLEVAQEFAKNNNTQANIAAQKAVAKELGIVPNPETQANEFAKEYSSPSSGMGMR